MTEYKLVPMCFRSLVKYAEWQMNEGANYHPTLPSCITACKAMLSAAEHPQTVDVEKLKRELHDRFSESRMERREIDAVIDHLAARFDFVEKEQK